MSRKICWITWEDHRRSIELAKELGADYYFVKSNETFVLRHVLKALKTISIIYTYRKGFVVVQNPSRVLAALAAMLKLIFRFPLVVDRHSNFRLGKGFSINPAIWFVIMCSEFSLRVADLTIVTNEFLKKTVEKKGGRAIVLHDKIPNLKRDSQAVYLPGRVNILFVCTFSPDEPFIEVIKAAKRLPRDYCVLITGNYNKAGLHPSSDLVPHNVHLLGFVSSDAYDSYVYSCDAMMVLTTSEWVLVCGGYEAMAAEKPLITSNTATLRGFYGNAAEFTNADCDSIASAMMNTAENLDRYKKLIVQESSQKSKLWREQWSELNRFLDELEVVGE